MIYDEEVFDEGYGIEGGNECSESPTKKARVGEDGSLSVPTKFQSQTTNDTAIECRSGVELPKPGNGVTSTGSNQVDEMTADGEMLQSSPPSPDADDTQDGDGTHESA